MVPEELLSDLDRARLRKRLAEDSPMSTKT